MLASSRVSFRYEAMLVQREYYFNFKYFSRLGRDEPSCHFFIFLNFIVHVTISENIISETVNLKMK